MESQDSKETGSRGALTPIGRHAGQELSERCHAAISSNVLQWTEPGIVLQPARVLILTEKPLPCLDRSPPAPMTRYADHLAQSHQTSFCRMAAGVHQRILSCLVGNGVVTVVTAVYKTGPMVTTGTRGLSHPSISLSTSF